MNPVAQDIARRIRDATASGQPLCIRGGGSKDFLGAPPRGELLDMRALSGITSYEPSELVVTVLAGTPLHELEATLAAAGQCLPFEPPRYASPGGDGLATCGGMLASGLAGPARASVGGVRDHVLGLTMLNGRSECLRLGGQVMKNVAGYDLSRLMAGSMGILGVLLEMSIKVLPVPPAEMTLGFEVGQADALALLQRWHSQALPLNASCWFEDRSRPMLQVRLRGAAAAVEAACGQMGGAKLEPAQAASHWADCRDQRLPFFRLPPAPGLALWRLSLPPTSPALASAWPQLVEWHGGQRWLWAGTEQQSALRASAEQLGGHASLFRAADDAQRLANPLHPLTPATWRLHRELKRQFDPAGIFNPGRLYPDL